MVGQLTSNGKLRKESMLLDVKQFLRFLEVNLFVECLLESQS